ncbi:hypothetical protein ACIP5Y_31035 [Nocardia sp. NPDC088792]|uniref:hypothetical protein n=1 Tax=Nocardia sp. NPDC088792 TaxID=3364332 RepID=UPI0037FF34A9
MTATAPPPARAASCTAMTPMPPAAPRMSKEILIAEAFTDQMHACRSIVEEGLADPDAWQGFCHTIEQLCELQARDHGFTAAFMSTFPRAVDFAAIRTASLTAAADLIRRAEATGNLRPDVATT